MDHKDQVAIVAASAQIRLINWVADHPHQPVPADIVRLAMETMADFFIERVIAKLEFNPGAPLVATDGSLAEPLDRDTVAPYNG